MVIIACIVTIWLIGVMLSFVLFKEKSIFDQHPWRDHLLESALYTIFVFIVFAPPFLVAFISEYFGVSERWSEMIAVISVFVWIYLIDKYKIVKRRE